MVMDNSFVLDEHPMFNEENSTEETPNAETTTQVETPVETTEETPNQGESEEDFFIRLDKRNLQEQLEGLLANDPDARQIFNRYVGNKAKQRYQPQIDELKSHVSTYQQLIKRNEFSKLSEEEVNEKFKTDPQFAQEYAQIAHAEIAEPTELTVEAITPRVIEGIGQIIRSGARQGLTREDLAEIEQGLKSGRYDRDETGADLPPQMWQEMLDNVQADVTERILKNRLGTTTTETTPPVETPPVETPPVNNPTDTARPDMSNGGGRGTRQTSMTIKAFRELPVDEQITIMDNWYPQGNGSASQAIADGKIVLETGS